MLAVSEEVEEEVSLVLTLFGTNDENVSLDFLFMFFKEEI